MARLLSWFSILQFIASPIFVVAFIWQSDFKFFWIGAFLLIFSFITTAFNTSFVKQQSPYGKTIF